MAIDALDPGPDGGYPNLDMNLQPVGVRKIRNPNRPGFILVDLEATGPDGRRVSQIAADTP